MNMKDKRIVRSAERLVRYSPERVVEPGKKFDQAYPSMSGLIKGLRLNSEHESLRLVKSKLTQT